MEPNFQKDGEGNYISFEWASHKNEALSEKEGRPIFDKQLVFHITSPGLTKSIFASWIKRTDIHDKVVTNQHFARKYAPQVRNFEEGMQAGNIQGTPLEELPFLDVHIRAMLRAQNVHTAEALAELSEAGIAEVGMGARLWVQQAKNFLEQAAGGAPLVRLTAENQRQAQQIEELRRQLGELAGKLEEMQDEQPARRGPGRPRKLEAEAA